MANATKAETNFVNALYPIFRGLIVEATPYSMHWDHLAYPGSQASLEYLLAVLHVATRPLLNLQLLQELEDHMCRVRPSAATALHAAFATFRLEV